MSTPLASTSFPSLAPARTALAPAIAQSQQRDLDEQRTFGAVLGRAVATPTTKEEDAREAARGLVTQALVQPVLKGLRESTWAAAPFAPTSGERSMRALLDDHLAQRIVTSENWSLIAKVQEVILRKGGQLPSDVAGPQGGSALPAGSSPSPLRAFTGGAA